MLETPICLWCGHVLEREPEGDELQDYHCPVCDHNYTIEFLEARQ
jgi:rubrerythrin